MNQCDATRANGERCRANALPGRPQCFAHDPDNRALRDKARRAGGHNSSTVARAVKHLPPHFATIATQLLEAITEVHEGKLSPQRLTAMSAGASAVVRIFEVGEFETRLAQLEERAAQPNSATRRGW